MTDIVLEIFDCIHEETGRDLEELPPLQETIDVDALKLLVDDATVIEFEYAGCTIKIENEDITVTSSAR